MDKFEKDKSLLNGKGEKDLEWFTTENGTHVPLKQGQTKAEAIKKHFAKSNDKVKTKSLENQVEEVLSGKFKGSHVVLSEETPKILQDIGVSNKPFLMTSKHTYLAINESGIYKGKDDHYHNLGKEVYLMLPKLLESPAIVLQKKDSSNDIVAVLNWYDKDKNILICPIRINGTAKYNQLSIEGHIVKSVYGKDNFRRYINKNFRQKDILSVGNKKIRDIHQ